MKYKKLFISLIFISFICLLIHWNNIHESKNINTFTKEEKYNFTCSSNYVHNLNWILAITPTKPIYNQLPSLINLSQALHEVKNIFWLLIVDGYEHHIQRIYPYLKYKCLNGIIFNVSTKYPTIIHNKENNKSDIHHRGLEQRNFGLNWIKDHIKDIPLDSIIYFMDDDNTYDIRLFQEIRETRNLKIWPVGYIGNIKFEGPYCNPLTNEISTMVTSWGYGRNFALDMAGFSFSLKYLYDRELNLLKTILFKNNSIPGFMESDFLNLLSETKNPLKLEQISTENCGKILVWHTKYKKLKIQQSTRHNIDWKSIVV